MAAKPTPITRAITELMPQIDGMTTREITEELIKRGVDIPLRFGVSGSREKRQRMTIANTLNGFRQGKNPRLISHQRKKTADDSDASNVRWYLADRPLSQKLSDTLGPRNSIPDPPSPLAKPAAIEEDKPVDIHIVVPLTPEEASITRDMLRKLAPMMADDIAEKLMILYYGFRNAIGEAA